VVSLFAIPEVVVPRSPFLPKVVAIRLPEPASGARHWSDEQLVALLRRGHRSAFDTLAARYQPRLLWYCRRMLRSTEDAEDALQDVFVAAFNAILADEREIRVRPWLYRIASNRCLDQLRRSKRVSVDSMDGHRAENGRSLLEQVSARQDLQDLVGDMQGLPVTQRTALLLREIDGLSYKHIALATGTTVAGVKSLLVRARTGLRDSAVARHTTPGVRRLEPALGRTRALPREATPALSYPPARVTTNAAA